MAEPRYQEEELLRCLGLQPGAGLKQIKSAYRRLARELHPDSRPGDPAARERFLQVQRAYQILSASPPPARRRHSPGKAAYHAPRVHPLPEGFLDGFRRGLGAWPRRGQDLRARLELEPADARRGGVFAVTLPRRHECHCGSPPRPACPNCGGRGWFERQDTLVIELPGGLRPGERIRVPGQGDAGCHGGRRGDLYLEVSRRG